MLIKYFIRVVRKNKKVFIGWKENEKQFDARHFSENLTREKSAKRTFYVYDE